MNKNDIAALKVLHMVAVATLVITALNQSPITGVLTAIAKGVPIVLEKERKLSYKKLEDRLKSLESKSSENEFDDN
ncbi:MAG: hypothetical protein F6J92_03215 [Symploca sp. SIO1A3]|nr:hypothetical protein [Symploca sp. SIO1A3]